MTETIPRLKTNLDADFLKLVAIISMLLDHIGGAFFPQYPISRWLGRPAFPIFCYRLTIGLLCTHDIKRYFGRPALLAAISQLFYVPKVDPSVFVENLNSFNIFFTLILNLLFMWGITQRRWYGICTSILALAVLGIWNFDYSSTRVILMLILYFCRRKPAPGCTLYCLFYLPALWRSLEDPLVMVIGGQAINWTILSLLAAPLVFHPTYTGIKINR